MPFFKNKADHTAPAGAGGDNPYMNGRQEWLERYGSYISRASHWRLAFLLAAVALIISISGNVMQSAQIKVVPYIVQVDQLGKTGVVTRADVAGKTPKALVQSEIANCITSWRTVTADVELQQKFIDRLSFFMAGSAKGVMREWYESNNPYEIAKSGKLVHVEVKGLPLPVSSDSYRVEWVETVRSHTGVVLDSNTYEATATIQLMQPTSEAVILRNPGGVYITSLSAGKVIGVAPVKTSTPKPSENADR